MGDYIYERFTPDRFQSFCSALLVKEYPGYQVFPVGQADGGRDGTAPGRSGQNSLIIQVKFKRQLKVNEDYFSWLKAAVLKEKERIDALIAKGAEEYKLVTNVPGTGKDRVGTMDKVHAFLKDNFDIPVQVLWRDDLDARISNNYDLKWVYSEILATPDVVRELFEQGFGSDNKRRSKAISDYIRSQYETDAFVKFKQADLQASDLLNLFIDVPGDLPPQLKLSASGRQDVWKMLTEILSEPASRDAMHSGPEFWAIHGWVERGMDGGNLGIPAIPVGSLLLHPAAAERFPRVLVEGAPGQGKSTLAQYLCQVHRMHFLGTDSDLRRIPAVHRLSPTRIPFKIDLRDLATWVDGLDPRKVLSETEHGLAASLESFIAAEVRFLSGGQEFSVSDLHELAASTPIVIVLDGFDEIATPDQRAVVVREIDKGLLRLSDGALSVQAIVTSRPSAMPDSPTFNRNNWVTVALSSITNDLALEYAGRWSSARNLTATEQQEVIGILSEKIQSPHLSDLARNPMQLTILLSLIHVRGQSLPDQRTALYESYIEVFFNREAEKTRVVRDNRQLLLDLHGYLAWKMHSDAELSRGDGRLTSGELQQLIKEWLIRRDYPVDAVEELFQGIVQRIVAIVSRVEGTFEFEVQPLREYFAAHHLYHTAPYSPPGRPETGTKPEILAALIENPYWQNVLRFFAGFYSVGEIPGLAAELIDRLEKQRSSTPLYDRVLSVNLLSDWVFHQQPTWTRKVVKAAVDDLTLRSGSDRAYSRFTDFYLDLPSDCGGKYAGEYAYRALSHAPLPSTAAVVRRHIPDHELMETWLSEALGLPATQAHQHILKGRLLGVMNQLSTDEVDSVRKAWKGAEDLSEHLTAAGCSAVLAESGAQLAALSSALEGHVDFGGIGGEWSRLAALFNPAYLNQILEGHFRLGLGEETKPAPTHKMVKEVAAKLQALEAALTGGKEVSADLDPWQQAVDVLEAAGRGSYSAHLMANVGAGIRSSSQRGAGARNLFDATVPLTQRVRFARMRPNGTAWWREQYVSAVTDAERSAWALHMSTWAGEKPVLDLLLELETAIGSMTTHQYRLLLQGARSNPQTHMLRTSRKQWGGSWTSSRFRLLFLFATRDDVTAQAKAVELSREGSIDIPSWALSSILSWILRGVSNVPTRAQWRSLVSDVERLGWTDEGDLPWRWTYHYDPLSWENLSEATARKIMEQPLQMPNKFVHAAVSRLGRDTPAPRALGEIAGSRNWAAN